MRLTFLIPWAALILIPQQAFASAILVNFAGNGTGSSGHFDSYPSFAEGSFSFPLTSISADGWSGSGSWTDVLARQMQGAFFRSGDELVISGGIDWIRNDSFRLDLTFQPGYLDSASIYALDLRQITSATYEAASGAGVHFILSTGPLSYFSLSETDAPREKFILVDFGQIPIVGNLPEPSTWTTMLVGFGMLGGFARRDRGRNQKVAVSRN